MPENIKLYKLQIEGCTPFRPCTFTKVDVDFYTLKNQLRDLRSLVRIITDLSSHTLPYFYKNNFTTLTDSQTMALSIKQALLIKITSITTGFDEHLTTAVN